VLKRTWEGPVHLELILADISRKEGQLKTLAQEASASGRFASVRTATDLAALQEASYVVVVTNASGAIIKPEHLTPGTVVIDDSQPRNTSPELVAHGCHVIDVLARVPGLDCNFDFGFRTTDRSVTFTCLAETVLATVAGDLADLAVGEVTDAVVERTLQIAQRGRDLGLIGELPFFSFGRELSVSERNEILRPVHISLASAAE
jgi:predicted amino acid dehydrogenase